MKMHRKDDQLPSEPEQVDLDEPDKYYKEIREIRITLMFLTFFVMMIMLTNLFLENAKGRPMMQGRPNAIYTS